MIRVSVAMATYNGENHIKEQLDSILVQLTDDDEVVISDDGSSDRTVRIIENYKDRRIKLHYGGFRDFLKNFNSVLSKCEGNYIFLCDQDDVWEPGKLEIMVRQLERHNVVVSDCLVVNGELNTLYDSFFEQRKSGAGFFKNLASNSYLGCCMAFRKEVLQVALPFPKKVYSHDTWIGLIAELQGEPVFIKDKLLKYRRHGNNTSGTSEKSQNGIIVKFKIRFYILLGLVSRFRKIRALRN